MKGHVSVARNDEERMTERMSKINELTASLGIYFQVIPNELASAPATGTDGETKTDSVNGTCRIVSGGER
ncbi:MAG: hypothetical protein ABI723_21695 [Bacteroidia bacterium]